MYYTISAQYTSLPSSPFLTTFSFFLILRYCSPRIEDWTISTLPTKTQIFSTPSSPHLLHHHQKPPTKSPAIHYHISTTIKNHLHPHTKTKNHPLPYTSA